MVPTEISTVRMNPYIVHAPRQRARDRMFCIKVKFTLVFAFVFLVCFFLLMDMYILPWIQKH